MTATRFPDAAERRKRILQAIISTYIVTGEAVGSRTIAKNYALNLSPASVRNVMADLEEAGYIEQPHTSAGRIPTDLGYRFYINSLMRMESPPASHKRKIEQELETKTQKVGEIVEKASKLLAGACHNVAIVQSPSFEKSIIRRIEFVHYSPEKALVVLITNVQTAESQIIELWDDIMPEDLDKIPTFLNERVGGLTVREAKMLLTAQREKVRDESARLFDYALRLFDAWLSPDSDQQIYLEGAVYMFDHPEFQDLDKAKAVFQTLERKEILSRLLNCDECDAESDRVRFVIGSENEIGEMRQCSLVFSPYRVGDLLAGALGIIGPTRMQYSRIAGLVSFMAEELGEVLTGISIQ